MSEKPASLHCPVCLGGLSIGEIEAVCVSCGARWRVEDGIPLMVPDAEAHLGRMEREIAANPAWYESDQIAWHDRGPCRSHLLRRRAFIENILDERFGKGGKAGRLLDLGCGDGANARWLADRTKSLCACDYNLTRLRRCAGLLGGRAALCLADVHHLPWPDDHFDVVFFNHVLEHIVDDERALSSVRRILKPGGLLLLGVPNEGCAWWRLAYRLQPESLRTSDHVHFYEAPELEEKARARGFRVAKTHYTGYGPPHWKLDEALRRFRVLDGLFELLGRILIPRQATSLYLILEKPEKEGGRRESSVDVRLHEPTMEPDWRRVVDASPEAWLFHSRDFIVMTKPVFDMREFSLTAWKNNELVGILPLNYSKRERTPRMGSLAFGSAGPALIEGLGEHEREAILRVLLERALRLCAQEGCRGLEAALPPLARAQLENRSGASPLDPLGFSSISTSTYVLDLRRDETELLAGFRQAVRRAIRMAEKEGVQIRPADRPEDAETYYRLHCETYERTGATPHPAAYFKGIFEKMAPRGLCQIWTAEREGRPLAFANIGLFKKTAYYWTGCGSEEGLQVGANHLLQWRVIQRLKADGVEWYEVGEAFPAAREGDKKAGLDLFKRGFGGERRPFFRGRIDMPERAPSRLRLSLYYLKRSLRILLGGR